MLKLSKHTTHLRSSLANHRTQNFRLRMVTTQKMQTMETRIITTNNPDLHLLAPPLLLIYNSQRWHRKPGLTRKRHTTLPLQSNRKLLLMLRNHYHPSRHLRLHAHLLQRNLHRMSVLENLARASGSTDGRTIRRTCPSTTLLIACLLSALSDR